MAVTESDLREIEARVRPILGQKATRVEPGRGSVVTLEFDVPGPGRRLPDQGQGPWRLRLTAYCSWRVEQGMEFLAGDGDPPATRRAALRRIEGRELRRIALTPPALETTMEFAGDVRLHLFPVRSEDVGLWMLTTPDGHVLSIGPGSRWSCDSAEES